MRRFVDLFRAASWPSLLALAVGIAATISGCLTYAVMTGLLSYAPTTEGLIGLMALNLTLVLALIGLIAWRLMRLWTERRSGIAGARLHVRLVAMFAAVAVTPAILVAVFAAVTLNYSVEAWFSKSVRDALSNAVLIADRYEQEHEHLIVADAYEIANSIERDPQLFNGNKVDAGKLFAKLATLTKDRGLQASYIIDSQGHILGSTKQRSLPDIKPPSPDVIHEAATHDFVIDANSKLGVVRALIRMQALNDAYLLVVRAIDPEVFAYYQSMVAAKADYQQKERNQFYWQVFFGVLYALVVVLFLLASMWLGLWAANRLVRPISRLIGAAERVSEGDLKAQVEIERGDDELGNLGRAFNRMTQQLDAQRSELMDASQQIDVRRRFTEAVLAGVSAGVVGLDIDGNVTIVNRAAARLLNATPDEMEGRHYSEAVPELAGLIRRAAQESGGKASGEAAVKRDGTARTLSVQVNTEAGHAGFVVTFDDITELVSAQRTAAWADVARRIAHEIKNPLTPIQLSAERLKRKYALEVETDPEVFAQCTDTIIRQVGDIGRMVDEFSSFARMPSPIMRRENLQELVQQAVFLQRVAHSSIVFESKLPPAPVYAHCDGRLLSQAMTNVLKNAAEAVDAREAEGDAVEGRIVIALEASEDAAAIRIRDNGIGLPPEHRHRLTEPYVTTRAKGTGLGLAIVRKILEDHGGEIAIADLGEEERGAEVRLILPLRQKSVKEKASVGDEQERILDRA